MVLQIKPNISDLTIHRNHVDELWRGGQVPYNVGARSGIYEQMDRNLFSKVANNPNFDALKNAQNLYVLDSGAGMGSSYAKFLKERGANIISLDMSKYPLNEHWLFAENYPMNSKILGNFFDLPVKDSSIDIVVSSYFMADNPLFIENTVINSDVFNLYLNEVNRVLKDGGIFMASDPRISINEKNTCTDMFSYVFTDTPCFVCAKK